MSYIIKLTEVIEDTLNTDVEYTFEDGTIRLIRVSHFMPESIEQVIANIEAREKSEQKKQTATLINEEIQKELTEFVDLPSVDVQEKLDISKPDKIIK